jgi:hypothetical protein
MHAVYVTNELSEREQALRRLPLPYSLALRLRDAGVAAEVICQYVDVEQAALDGLYRIADAKLLAAHNTTDEIATTGTGEAASAPRGGGEGHLLVSRRGSRSPSLVAMLN